MMRGAVPALLAALVAIPGLLLTPKSVSAHLSIIRQGAETAGANEAGDALGQAVATGDFNGDGLDDLAMGAPNEDVGTLVNAGAVAVNYAGGYGITHEGAVIYTASNMNGTPMASAYLGYALAVADLNHDGFDDLIVGAPYETINGNFGAGAFYVMRGSPTGLQPWLRRQQTDFSSASEANDRFGFSFATGNWNGDDYVDLVIGSPGEGGLSGAVIWVLGTASGPFGSYTYISVAHAGETPSSGELFGYSLAAGNVMGGPEDEIIIGVPYFDDGDIATLVWGAVVVTPGSPTGPRRSDSILYPQHDVAWSSSQTGSQFGRSLAVGRIMGGAYEAVAIGAPAHDAGSLFNAGQVMVVPGSSGGLNVTDAVTITQASAGGIVQANESFGLSLAVGYYWDPGDGYEDLAVGSPAENYGSLNAGGLVQILNGGPVGPTGVYGWSGFNQGTLNERIESTDFLGSSLAFGFFDLTGNGNLAVGAAGEDNGAGMVHVIAPWRQRYNLSCERSIVLDCDENIYFSQKPFDQVYIASITKIMTVLLACEDITTGQISPDAIYTVPAWVANDIPGSQVPLYENEWMRLEDLMYTCLLRSGNDAAFAIADLLHGSTGPDNALQVFINRMNVKAGLIGMTGTNFHNPAGLDNEPVGPERGEHYSTPQDMAILSAYAMKNALFRQVAGATSWELVRHFVEFDHYWECNNIFTGVLMNGIEPLSGIKGGYTGNALTTGCFAGESPTGGRSIAGTYTTPDPPDNYAPDAGALVQLGLEPCGYFFALPLDWEPNDPFNMGGIESGDDDRYGSSAAIPRPWDDDLEFSVFRTRWDGSESSRMDLCIAHQIELGGAVAHDFGATNVLAHGEITITNVHDQTATGQMTLPYGVEDIFLEPGETLTLPERSDGWSSFDVEIYTFGDDYLYLDIVIPYWFEVTSSGSPHGDAVFQARLIRDPAIPQDGIEVRTLGHDAEANLYSLVGHAPGAVLGAPDGGGPSTVGDAPLVQLRAAHPNPFRSGSRIGFDLGAAGEVGVDIYDVTGRLVRSYAPVAMQPGAWGVRWDGRADHGREVAAGTYLYHVTVDGQVAATGKMVRVE
jgi:D-alanyl-D-alanine carboxypeptidase